MEAELGKHARHFAHQHRVKSADDRYAKLPETAAAVVLRNEVEILRAAVADVHADCDVEPAHLIVERIKVGIGNQAVTFDAAHEHAASPMLRTKSQLLQ